MLKALSLWPAIGQYEKMPATGVPMAEQVTSDIVLLWAVLNPGAAAGAGVFGWHSYFLFSSINRRASSCTHHVWHQQQKSASSPGICPGWSH